MATRAEGLEVMKAVKAGTISMSKALALIQAGAQAPRGKGVRGFVAGNPPPKARVRKLRGVQATKAERNAYHDFVGGNFEGDFRRFAKAIGADTTGAQTALGRICRAVHEKAEDEIVPPKARPHAREAAEPKADA